MSVVSSESITICDGVWLIVRSDGRVEIEISPGLAKHRTSPYKDVITLKIDNPERLVKELNRVVNQRVRAAEQKYVEELIDRTFTKSPLMESARRWEREQRERAETYLVGGPTPPTPPRGLTVPKPTAPGPKYGFGLTGFKLGQYSPGSQSQSSKEGGDTAMSMLNALKTFDPESTPVEELVALVAFGQGLTVTYTNLGLEAPDWIGEKVADVEKAVRDRYRDAQLRELKETEARLEALKSTEEKRGDLQAKRERLKKALGQ